MVDKGSFFAEKNCAILLMSIADKEMKESELTKVISNYYSINIAATKLVEMGLIRMREESNGSRKARVYTVTELGIEIAKRLKEIDEMITEGL